MPDWTTAAALAVALVALALVLWVIGGGPE